MLCFPNSKINIGLFVTGQRSDGYRNLETVFYPIGFKDILEIVPAKEESSFHLSGKKIEGAKENNLVWKAFEMLRSRFPDKVPLLDIYLHKNISMGAGLGGGSSDGAFMLRLLNDFCKLNLDAEALAAYALELGSDCPFFIYNTPQFASGRGEMFQPVKPVLSGFRIDVICPQIHVSTGAAFRMIQPGPAGFDLRTIDSLDVKDWKEHVKNDFEEPVFKMYPELKDLKKQLYNQGAVYASLTGSGAAVYGIFPKGSQKPVIKSSLKLERFEEEH